MKCWVSIELVPEEECNFQLFFIFPAYDVLGPFGKLWVEICIIGYLFGCCVAYVVVLGDLGPEILNNLQLNYSLYWSRILLMTGTRNILLVS